MVVSRLPFRNSAGEPSQLPMRQSADVPEGSALIASVFSAVVPPAVTVTLPV